MPRHLDLRHFRYFIAVAEELSFRGAADRLNLSQPPLSRQIRQLEDELGASLFRRSRNGATLTEAGEAFLPEARRTLDQVGKSIAAVRATLGSDGRQFVVGYSTVFDRSAFPDMSETFHRHLTNWRLVLVGKHSINLVRDVRNGTMDAAFIALHTDVQGLTADTLSREPVVVAISSRHPLARKRKIAFSDLQDEPLFWFERRLNPGYFDYCQAFFEKVGFKPRFVPEPPDHHVLLGYIAERRGFALISASLRKVRRDGVVYRELRDGAELSMGITLVYSDTNQSPALPHFIEMVRQRSAMGGINGHQVPTG